MQSNLCISPPPLPCYVCGRSHAQGIHSKDAAPELRILDLVKPTTKKCQQYLAFLQGGGSANNPPRHKAIIEHVLNPCRYKVCPPPPRPQAQGFRGWHWRQSTWTPVEKWGGPCGGARFFCRADSHPPMLGPRPPSQALVGAGAGGDPLPW